ncbi:MAG: AAA family ATPase, partial [Turicibacter sp.]
MFETFYQLNRTPFVRDIKTLDLFESAQMKETLGRLSYTIERQLFTVITGNSGVGKTTTIRHFTETIDRSKYCVMYLADSKLTPRNFYKELLQQLGCEAKFYR